MKTFLIVLAFVLLVFGLISSLFGISMVWMAVFVSEERLGGSAFLLAPLLLPTLIYGIAAVVCSLSHLKRRTKATAYPLATVTGFTVWILSSSVVTERIPAEPIELELAINIAVFGIPILLGIATNAILKNLIDRTFAVPHGELMTDARQAEATAIPENPAP